MPNVQEAHRIVQNLDNPEKELLMPSSLHVQIHTAIRGLLAHYVQLRAVALVMMCLILDH